VADVFISYSRRDSDYVRRLQRDLESRGKDVWVDVEAIRDAEVFPDALRRAIEGSDAFVFVISPDSVQSQFCEQEVTHALELNKRIVPLALREVPDADIPEEIRFRNWIPVDGEHPFEAGVDRLVSALETDLEWEHQHTRLTVKALEWDGSGRDRSFLLRGSDLSGAERWLAAGADKDPGPSGVEQEYLLAARAAASRRQRGLVGASLAVAAVSVGLLIFALISRSQAISARNTARAQALTAKSRALAAESQTQLPIDPERSVLLASAAVRTSPTSDAQFALRAALDASPIRYRLADAGLQSCNPGLALSPTVAFSPNGDRVAEGVCGGTVVLADARTGTVIRRLHIRAPAAAVAYNDTGSLLAIAGGGRIILVDPANGVTRDQSPPLHEIASSRVVFSPVAREVAFGGQGGVTLWNFHTGAIRQLALTPGQRPPSVLSGGPPPRPTGRASRHQLFLLPPPSTLAFSPDGRLLAVGLPASVSGAPGLLVLDVRRGRVLARSTNFSDSVDFSPDGRQLAVAETTKAAGGRIVIRDPRTLALRRTLVRLPGVEASAVAFSPDGSRVLYGGFDGTAGLVSAASGQPLVSYLGQTAAISEVAFSVDGRLAATASQDGTLRVWRATGLALSTTDVAGNIVDMRPVPGGFVTLDQPAGRAGVDVEEWAADGRAQAVPLTLSRSANVNAMFISPDGRLAGLIGNPTQRVPVTIWNISQRRVIATVPPSLPPSGGQPAFSPDGKLLALSKPFGGPQGIGSAFGLVDVRTGRFRILGHSTCEEGWRGYTFSRTKDLVAAGSFCGEVSVWNVASGKQLWRSFSIGGELASLAFSPDGTRLAAASWNSTITILDVRTGRLIALLTDHTRGVADVAYSPDGRYLASASLDDTARIWDAQTLTLLRVIRHPDAVYGVAFTADSQDILTTDGAGVVREWDACTACENPRGLLAIARTRVTRQLTPQERRTFGVS
jgi:WD40 repeat protein